MIRFILKLALGGIILIGVGSIIGATLLTSVIHKRIDVTETIMTREKVIPTYNVSQVGDTVWVYKFEKASKLK